MNKQNSTLLELKLYKITTVKTNGITKRRGTKKKGRRHARAQRLYEAQFKVSHYFVHRPKCTDQKTLTGRHIDKEERNLPSSAVNSTLAVVYYLYTLAYVSSSRLFFFFLSPHLNCGSTIGETTPISLKEQ